jgi:hypothetical protein
MHTLNQLIHRLLDARIDFVIIGGYAGVLHGSAYNTRDLDICVVLTPANIQRLRDTLADLHPKHRMTPQRLSFLEVPREGGPPLQSIYLNTDWGTIDILTNVIGVGDFARLKSKAAAMPFEDKTCLVMSLDDLIKTKETLGREKDLLVAKELRCIAAARKQPPQN